MSSGQKQTKPPAQGGITPAMQAHLDGQLEAGEQVLWAGTTDTAGQMKTGRTFMIIVCGFLMVMCSGIFLAMDRPGKWLLVVLSLLGWPAFAALALWLQSGHLRRVLYAVTDRRALILTVGKSRRTESYPPEKLEFLRMRKHKSGLGSLYFREEEDMEGKSYGVGFVSIADVEQVAALMQRTFGPLP
jgi:hypothetical protein